MIEMKLKQFATIVLTSLLIATIFGTVAVYAPAPSKPSPPTLWDVFITNTSDDPVPVDIIDGTVDVNLDEPIEVTNPPSESLDVEITNTEDIPVDVSGWLHTTDDWERSWSIDDTGATPREITTRGYRQITVLMNADVDGHVWFDWGVGDDYRTTIEEYLEFEALHYYGRTYEVRGHTLLMTAFADSGGGNIEVWAYLTT
jgi:hypothetical protein